jgi:four helix bundle protein
LGTKEAESAKSEVESKFEVGPAWGLQPIRDSAQLVHASTSCRLGIGLKEQRRLRSRNTNEAQDAARQLRRAANSTRANYRSARKGGSRGNFEWKLAVAREEADECVGWLEYLRDAGIGHEADLVAESRALAAILTTAVKTAKKNSNRMQELPKS